MGLFGFGKPKAAKRASEPKPTKIKMPRGDVFDLPEGDYEGMIYTFDARPLGNLRKGDRLRLILVPGDHDLYSIYTKNVSHSKQYEDTNCCLTYKGYAVGYLTSQRQYLSKVVEKYQKVSVLVEYVGFDSYMGYPELTARMPGRAWFEEELGIRDNRIVYRDPSVTTVNVPDTIWATDAPDGYYDLTFNVIPTPKGSSAKPHIRVLLDGMVCAEVTGRQGCYNAFASMVDSEITECCIYNKVYPDGGISHRLEIKRKIVE